MIDRYTLSKMGNIWSEKHKMDIMLKVEILACEAMCKQGNIPKKSMEKIKKNAKFDIDEVKRLEEKTKHDIVAFINNVGKSIGAEARYLHMGLTSSDLLDTSLSVQCVAIFAGFKFNFSQTNSSTNGSMFAYVPTAPDNLP